MREIVGAELSVEEKAMEQELRGQEAERILDHPLIGEVFQKMEDAFDQAWIDTLDGETDLRERIYLSRKLLRRFKHEFKQMVITGESSNQLLNASDPINPTNVRRFK